VCARAGSTHNHNNIRANLLYVNKPQRADALPAAMRWLSALLVSSEKFGSSILTTKIPENRVMKKYQIKIFY